MLISLNGSDWKATGWWKHQWRFTVKDEGIGEDTVPAVATVEATVPGALQADLVRAGILQDLNTGLNSIAAEWVNNREWFYDREFSLPEGTDLQKYYLCFDGLDDCGEIYLNGEWLADFSGMFLPVEIDVTGKLRRDRNNFLRIVFFQTPEVDGQFGFSNRINRLKSRFNYIWDWCPRIVPVGIWEDVYLKAFDGARILDFYPRTRVDRRNHSGSLDLVLELDAQIPGQYEVRYTIRKDGRDIARQSFESTLAASRQILKHSMNLECVELWWPNNQGERPLYDVAVEVLSMQGRVCDTDIKRVGFRDIRFVQNEKAPAGALPYTAMVNGRRVFLRGVNWVPISPLYGAVSAEQYRKYLQRFKDMNCNILRVWGGAILEKKAFYDACDEMGLMVWQEFPQSSSGHNNSPPEDPQFLKVLKATAEIFIRRRRHHASHILWCGGNELMWEEALPVNEHHSNIKMLKELVREMDPDKVFLPSSASGPVFVARVEDFGKGLHHDVHGPWSYTGTPEHYRFFNGDDALFRSETGCPGISRPETLERHKGGYEVWPPDKTNPYWVHRGAWWLQKKQLTELFGKFDEEGRELLRYVKASRYLQAEALRYAVEATRRREPEASGFIIWMGNEPFPNNANTSVIEYDGTPKPAYYWVRNAFSCVHASARYASINYQAGEQFTCEVFLHSEQPEPDGYEMVGRILSLRGEVLWEKTWSLQATDACTRVGGVEWTVQACENHVFFFDLLVGKNGLAAARNTYLFTTASGPAFEPVTKLPPCHVTVEKASADGGSVEWRLTNVSSVTAAGVFLNGKDPSFFMEFSDNYFTLLPGENKTIMITSGCPEQYDGVPFHMEALNLDEKEELLDLS